MSKIIITSADKRGIFLWRKILVPLFEIIGGKNFPKGIVKEFSYGKLLDEKLDYIEPQGSSQQLTAVVHIHGGGWIAGSKGKFYSKPLLKFAQAGYPVFSINYQRAPEQQHPYMLQSLLSALVWIKKNYPQFDSVHIIGDSAGGNLAMMIGIYISNPDILKMLSDIDVTSLPTVKSVCDVYGVNDRTTWIEDGFNGARLFTKMYLENTSTPHIPALPMEIEQINNLPPTFIVGAGKDKLLRSSKIWAERVEKQFHNTQFKVFDGADHGFFSFGKGCDELSDDMITFFRKYSS